MPTQEERINALERNVAWLQKKFDDADIPSVNHNATMLLGLAYKQQTDIKEIKISLTTIDQEISEIKQNLITMATKDDLATMATKDDLATMATKDDLATMATKDDLATMATKDDLATMENRVLGTLKRLLTAINSQHPSVE